MTTQPYFWIQSVTEGLRETNQIPLWGSPPPFPLEELELLLKEQFGLSRLSIKREQTALLEPDAFLKGLGDAPIILPLELTPIGGTFFFVIGMEDVKAITSFLMVESGNPKRFSHEALCLGFFRFISLNLLDTFAEISPYDGAALKIGKESSLPAERAFAIDVKIGMNGAAFWSRLITPPHFHQSFQAHFASKPPAITSKEFAASISAELTVEGGTTTLPFEEWQKVRVGDFILLDHCTYDLDQNKGSLEIVLGQTPLFQARLKEGSLKILDYAFYSEELNDMDEHESQEGEVPVSLPELPEGVKEEEHLWSEEASKAPLEQMLAASTVPITLTVEVGRLHMSLEKLLQLEPGNTLELKTRPEDGVRITLQGKPVAHAELVKIGEVLGIKILSLGK